MKRRLGKWYRVREERYGPFFLLVAGPACLLTGVGLMLYPWWTGWIGNQYDFIKAPAVHVAMGVFALAILVIGIRKPELVLLPMTFYILLNLTDAFTNGLPKSVFVNVLLVIFAVRGKVHRTDRQLELKRAETAITLQADLLRLSIKDETKG